MKYIVFICVLIFASVVLADDGTHSVLKNKVADATVQENSGEQVGWVVVPYMAGRRAYKAYVVPVQPRVEQRPLYVPPPVKPQFQTPIRDGAYYGMYYSRLWRWNRLGNKLNVQYGPSVPSTTPPVTPIDP